MRAGRDQQPLSYDLRLPEEAQEDALRLLEPSAQTINTALQLLWPRLDDFMGEQTGPAWKQVVAMAPSPAPHGERQWRCEAETAGRIMRAQAEHKQVFQVIQPILTDGLIRPRQEKRPAGKNRGAIKVAISALQKRHVDDEMSFVTMQNVIEQDCNYFLQQGTFPATYEKMQGIPLLKGGLLTYAGDDGGAKGQAYRLSFDVEAAQAKLVFRFPDEQGVWQWRRHPTIIPLPVWVVARLKEGAPLATTLREHVTRDGGRIAVLDVVVKVPKAPLPDWEAIERVLGFDWGVHSSLTAVVLDTHNQQVSRPLFVHTGGIDGHQARTSRQIDPLNAKRDQVAIDDPTWAAYDAEITRCWRPYEAHNQELAHLAANMLLLFAAVWGCSLVCGESLKTLKSTGRGKGVKGRWRNWRNNTTIRAEIWRKLRYNGHLCGLRFRSERPKDTSHTCPRCGKPAHTYRSPRIEPRSDPVKWGRWLVCSNLDCCYNADRDYCAAVNIARLGVAFALHLQTTGRAQAFTMTDVASVRSCPYMAHGAVLLFPPQTAARASDGCRQALHQWLDEARDASFLLPKAVPFAAL